LLHLKSSDVDSQGPAWSEIDLKVPSLVTHAANN